MKPIDIVLSVNPQDPVEVREVMEAALEALVRINMAMYRRYPEAHCCPHCAGVLYDPEEPRREAAQGRQRFVCADRLIAERVGACGSIAAMACARMRALEGKRARVVLEGKPGSNTFHAVVQLDDGRKVDPTAELQQAAGCSCG